jgi:hypothetical protein
MVQELTLWMTVINLFFLALMTCFAYFVARFGVEHFNKVFATLILATGVAYAILAHSLGLDTLWGVGIFSFEGYSKWYWGGILAVSVLFLIAARYLSHVAIFVLLTISLLFLVRTFGVNASPALSITAAAGSLVITFLLRRHTIKVLVGASSGLYLSVLISNAINYIFSETLQKAFLKLDSEAMGDATITYFVISVANPLIMMALGIALQYLWYEKIFGKRLTEKANRN